MSRSDDRLLRRATDVGPEPRTLHAIDPIAAGWSYVGFEARRLRAGDRFERPADDREVAVVALEGAVDVVAGRERFDGIGGRTSVFDEGPAELVLVEPGRPIDIVARVDATVVLGDAPGAEVRVTRAIRTGDIRVEARGSGSTARRIHHLLPPAAQAGRLILFEVYTPGGNWSSYPPHKHDVEDPPREAYLEELYYHRFARPEGWAFQRVYTRDRDLDEAYAVTDHDVVLVPRGYHPVGSPAGYDGYYLNVMAGPRRAWEFTLDPDHAWLMDWDPNAPR
jgi:5-deoxy-glucuronate isomerase